MEEDPFLAQNQEAANLQDLGTSILDLTIFHMIQGGSFQESW